jgi:hypothetical protein
MVGGAYIFYFDPNFVSIVKCDFAGELIERCGLAIFSRRGEIWARFSARGVLISPKLLPFDLHLAPCRLISPRAFHCFHSAIC